jgi:hypothetical protein
VVLVLEHAAYYRGLGGVHTDLPKGLLADIPTFFIPQQSY